MIYLLIAWFIPLFKTTIDLHKDGSLEITENITVDFSDARYHGIYRDIPLELRGRIGNYSLGFTVKEVLCDGKKAKVKKSYISPDGWKHLRLRIGDPNRTITGIHTYTIKYSVLLGARFFKSHDELYWNITGNYWEARIDSVDFAILFPEPIKLTKRDVRIFVGKSGSTETSEDYILNENSLIGWATGIEPGSGITVAIRFPRGYLHPPSRSKILLLKIRDNLPFLFPILLFIFMFYHWWNYGRDIPVKPVQVEYEAPEDTPAPEAGVVFDQRADLVDVLAILFELARRGYIKIKEEETKKFLFLKKKDYRITIEKQPDENLPKYMKVFLNNLITTCGLEFLASEMKENNFGEHLQEIKSELYKVVTSKGYFYGNPENVRLKYFLPGFFFVFFSIFFAAIFTFNLKIPLAMGMCGVILIAFSNGMPKLTPKGRRTLRKILGFREFLVRVEKPRLEKLLETNPYIFFDFLPYAIALGVVDQWAERFKGLRVKKPDWYITTGAGRSLYVASIAHSIGDSISTLSSAMTPPRGSSSGFSGGCSGGGGGGGGGGAW